MNTSKRSITEVEDIKRIITEQERRIQKLLYFETFVSTEHEILTDTVDKLKIAKSYLEQF